MDRETKTIHAELKQVGAEGSFEAVIATIGVIDSDGDIVESGAFNGATAPIVPAHNQGSVPLGKVKIEERGNEVVAVGQFNLAVASARDWHEAVKFDLEHPPPVQEWSWGYYPTESREDDQDGERIRRLIQIDTIEVSPVLRGASVGTRTLSAKAAKQHTTETSDGVWDAVRELRRLKAGEGMYAYGESFPHHFVDDKGSAGAASTRACLALISTLNGGSGDRLVPAKERKGIYDHLAGHLRDAAIEPPELRASDAEPGQKLVDQVRLVVWNAEAAIERLREISHGRQKREQRLSDEARAAALEMAAILEDLHTLSRKVAAMASACTPEDAVSRALAAWEYSKAKASLGT